VFWAFRSIRTRTTLFHLAKLTIDREQLLGVRFDGSFYSLQLTLERRHACAEINSCTRPLLFYLVSPTFEVEESAIDAGDAVLDFINVTLQLRNTGNAILDRILHIVISIVGPDLRSSSYYPWMNLVERVRGSLFFGELGSDRCLQLCSSAITAEQFLRFLGYTAHVDC
jgi:hypothetical protein